MAVVLFGAGALLMISFKRAAYFTILASMMIIPMYWTVMTVISGDNRNLPTAYSGSNQQGDGMNAPRPQGQDDGGPGATVNNNLLTYLEANTQDVEYLVAVPSSMQGSQMVIATGRPVLLMGGFGGQDDVVSADDLAQMVANGELRYVLYGGDRGNKQEIADWLKNSCSVVPEFSNVSTGNRPAQGANQANGQNQAQGPGGGGPGDQSSTLYMCK
jgi:4-amino-4-deoxy-L-arabinose transferase-like glycosyltransferase